MIMIHSCPKCKQIHIGASELCFACIKLEEVDFSSVSDYLHHHPNANADEVAKETNVDIHLVMKWIKEGRLISLHELTCERCGKKIKSGRFCSECGVDLQKSLHQMKQGLAKRTGYFTHIDGKK
ncbi:MAG: hypothetical protein OWR52_06640 [Acidibacillus sp.]|uniref:MerR family transcriptional regulator n=1 Tax=Sulfoacidibacillus ferrooxidans TaxID=2005001 RepID=A0A9X1V8B3_9BACL|nr:hypothetical protein [Sulfoacidibacillus ferrooxidans]MCY0893167.1 hypothetical protein [Acidibacillus sp.]